MRNIFVLFLIAALLFIAGCGIVGNLATPTSNEEMIKAEYPLADNKDKKLLVLVEQSPLLKSDINLRGYITEAVRKSISGSIKMPIGNIVTYEKVSDFRSSTSNFSFMSPSQIGKALKADLVMLITVDRYNVADSENTGVYNGYLGADAILIDAATGQKLWPDAAESKRLYVGFEMEKGGRGAAIIRLNTGLAKCLVRYFYDCSRREFRVVDDRSNLVWENPGK